MKPDNRFVTLFGICFIILSLSIGFGISQERKPLEKVSKEVSGIVIHREEGAIWIRLTSVDSLNNISTGTVFMYNLTDKNSDTKSGEYIRGTLLSGNSLLIQESYAFFDRDGGRGFVNKGDLLLISGGKITWDHSDPYPSFSLNVKNLGETEIIGIRASINGAQLPYTFEVTKRTPLEPSQNLYTNRYTAWYDPVSDEPAGYIPEEGEEYTVEFLVKYKNREIREYNRTEIYESVNFGSISSIAGFDIVYFRGGDLLSLGIGKGGSVYIYFRNEWWLDSAQTIDQLSLSINGENVMHENVHIPMGNYVAYCATIPFDLNIGEEYAVTLTAISTTGNISEYSKTVTCEYYKLR